MLCERLAGLGQVLGMRPSSRSNHRADGLAHSIDLAGLTIAPGAIRIASKMLAALLCVALVPILVIVAFVGQPTYLLVGVFVSACVAILAAQTILAIPSSLARKRAAAVLRSSPEATNLMIMSLRHDSSVSKAIAFASRRKNPFAQELRRCVWRVVMGGYSGFEEALHSVGRRWVEHGTELSTSLDALVTASREPSQEGRRRALDRANSAMISGAKRRIEEYALSLSAPSMVMFALGILLPLMVGSFLPMLSWNLWSLEPTAGSQNLGSSSLSLETVFLMNILFPAIALLVAMNAISRHPLETSPSLSGKGLIRPSHMAVALAVSAFALGCAWMVGGFATYPLAILAGVSPVAVLMVISGQESAGHQGSHREDLEDALFRTGARMLEGENFEAALGHAGSHGTEGDYVRSLSYRSNIIGQDFEGASESEARLRGGSNAVEGLRIVRDAASKDELDAGMLAMDLSAYLKDLHEIESSLKSRLKPTVSMMRMTVFALGPIVMGVTFAIYLSLASMTGAGESDSEAGMFMLLLGAFLAETDFVVGYFVWGIEGKKGVHALARSVGLSLLSSELIFVATATLAA